MARSTRSSRCKWFMPVAVLLLACNVSARFLTQSTDTVEKYATCTRYCKTTPEPENLFPCYEACRIKYLVSTSIVTTVTHTTRRHGSTTTVTVHTDPKESSEDSIQTFLFPKRNSVPGCGSHSPTCTVYTSDTDGHSSLVSADSSKGGSAAATATSGGTTAEVMCMDGDCKEGFDTPESTPGGSDSQSFSTESSSSSSATASSSSGSGKSPMTFVSTSGTGSSGSAKAGTTNTKSGDGVSETTSCSDGVCVKRVETCKGGECETTVISEVVSPSSPRANEVMTEPEELPTAPEEPSTSTITTGGSSSEAVGSASSGDGEGPSTRVEATDGASGTAIASDGSTIHTTSCVGTTCESNTAPAAAPESGGENAPQSSSRSVEPTSGVDGALLPSHTVIIAIACITAAVFGL